MMKSRERGENWSKEEKDLFLEIMRQSSRIVEYKKTDTNTNKLKNAEWVKVQSKLMELTGKNRDIQQLKGFWRRTKIVAKKNVAEHKRAIIGTGGGLPPVSPSLDDIKIMEMCPTDFVDEINEYDCDGIANQVNGDKIEDKTTSQGIIIIDKEYEDNPNEESFVTQMITVADIHNTEVQIETKDIGIENDHDQIKVKINKKRADKPKKNENSRKGIILAQNSELKKRSVEILDEEHKIKMMYHGREQDHQESRHKLEIELLLLQKNNLILEKEKKELEIKLLKKQLDEKYNFI